MIDTTNIQAAFPLHDEIKALLAGTSDSHDSSVRGWTIVRTTEKPWEPQSPSSYRCIHTELGIKLWTDGHQIKTIECSLPRLLFGTNGFLIRTDKQLRQALDKLWEILGSLTPSPRTPATLSRLDLVLHLPFSPQRFLPVLRHAKSPLVRRQTVQYNDSSVVFPGSEVRITAYDKMAEMKVGKGLFTRLEIQLRKKGSIKKQFGHVYLAELTIDQCYQVYRNIVLSFQLQHDLKQEYSEALLIALCHHNKFTPVGIPVLDWAKQSVSPKKLRQFEKAVAQDLSSLGQIDLGECLPPDGIPADMPDATADQVAPPPNALRARRNRAAPGERED